MSRDRDDPRASRPGDPRRRPAKQPSKQRASRTAADLPAEPTAATTALGGEERPPEKKTTTRKATKTTVQKSAKKSAKAPAKNAVTKKVAAKKVAAKKVPAKKVPANKVATKKVAAKKVATKKVAAKKVATKKAASRKATKAPAKKTAPENAKEASARKPAPGKARTTPAEKGAARSVAKSPPGRGAAGKTVDASEEASQPSAQRAPAAPRRDKKPARRRAEPATPERETAPTAAVDGAGHAVSRRRRISRDEILLSFEQRPPLAPPYPVEIPVPTVAGGSPRRLAFVLHAHLPWVLGHGTWPHGDEWLAEAIAHCYLPLLDAFRRLADRGRTRFVTLSMTPVLSAMLADSRTPPLVDRWLTARQRAAAESRDRHPLARWWREEYERLRGLWDSFDHDLIRALRELADRDAIELSTSAGTHVYLPLAHTEKLVRLALRTGRESHRELYQRDPVGCWMPECAYRPAGAWRHPVTGASEEFRPGNEEFLSEQGLQWTVVDAHLLRGGDPAFPYLSDLPPDQVAEPGGPHPEPYWIHRSSVAAFLRDARSAAQVWSRQGGYPGDGSFLDFHKRHSPSGLRLWRVTGATTDLADKLVYWPDDATARAREQAEHFVSLVGGLAGMDDGVVCAPFDAELFGHWWFEGPVWLERVLELAAEGGQVEATTPARELAAGPSLRRAYFEEGSWGAHGDHSVWVNPQTEWFWPELGESERRAFAAVRRGGSRAWRRAILNQLLLAAASDWPFLVTMGTGQDYAEMRFREHVARLDELIRLGPGARVLPDWAHDDLPFPEIEPEWALRPEA